MQCDDCHASEAIIHVTHIENNEMRTAHLCESCAAERGLEPGVAQAGEFPLTDFLAQVGKQSTEELPTNGTCSFCGLSMDEFKRTGRLGCSHCWVSFEPHLRILLRRLHGATQHVGKVYLPPDPTESEKEERIVGLRRKLDRAVRSEDFERAAELRDLIRSLEAVG